MDTPSHCPVSLPVFAEPLQSIGAPSVPPLSLPSDSPSSATSHVRKTAQGNREKQNNVLTQDESYRRATTICVLPDNVLLEVFDFYRMNHDYVSHHFHLGWDWHLLVHICQRWRQIVFASPQRLNLQILCTHRTSVRKNISIWPAIPIVIDYGSSESGIAPNDEDNVIAALEHPDRVCHLGLDITGSQLEKMSTVMQKPFPALTYLNIFSEGRNVPTLPAEFLGGSAPCLQTIFLYGIPFPALPTLLLSTSDLVEIHIFKLPPTGYIPPEVMVACLAALPRLHTFNIEFQSATPRPDRIRPPSVVRSVLPALTSFEFHGASEYLEDLVARIDGPQLNWIFVDYLNQFVDLQVAQLKRFIDRSVGPELTLFRHAEVTFSSDHVTFDVDRYANSLDWDWRPARTIVSCEGIDWQVSHMAQVLSHISATLSNVVHLKLLADPEDGHQLEGADDAEWLHLLRQISTVKTLHVSQELAGHIALALEDITEMVTEMLPSLDLIYLVGQPASSIEKFVAIRQLSGRPVAVIDTETEFDERLESYTSE